MKGSDKAIVLGVVMALILGAFYLKVLSPKREKASSLKEEVATLQSQVDEQKQTVAFGEDARRHFPAYYGRLVVMGKAVPADSDTSSLLVQLDGIADRTDVKFTGLTLGSGSESATTAAAPAAPAPPASGGTSTTTTPSTAPASATTSPIAATEATAADLPLGATVGPAGLPVMPYDLTFKGTYFDVADFLKGVDDLVHVRGIDTVAANGRLLTIDSFSLSVPDNPVAASPKLKVDLSVTSYITPADQGLTAGASPTAPAPSLSQPQTQPTSATVSP